MDRTVGRGTGFIGQYRPPVAAMFESLETCPDDLLLFMHHVPYKHRLHSGRTVIQHFYDAHYAGADEAAELVDQWQTLEAKIDEQRFREVLERLQFQAGHAQVWRDSICRWFMRRSGIPDEKGRVGNYPNRIEAEDQKLEGYQPAKITPWEAASGRGAAELGKETQRGSIQFAYDGPAGCCELGIQYFDEDDGVSQFKLFVNDKWIDQWQADGRLPTPTTRPDAHSSTRRKIRVSDLRPGDEIRIEGTADAEERAAVDYIEFHPCEL
jgi:alpha-glucuronidase